MDIQNQLLFFFSALGIFNGFVASIYFLFFTNQKRLSNYFLGLLLLFLCIRIGKSFLMIFFYPIPKPILQIGLSSCFLIGPALYFYLKVTLDNVKVINKQWKTHIIILLIIIIITGVTFPYKTNILFWNKFFVKFIYLEWIFYIIASAYVLRNVFKKALIKNQKITVLEKWLMVLYIGNLLICATYMVAYFGLYFIGPLSFSFVFYVLTFFLLFRKNRNTIFEDIPKKYSDKKITIEDASFLISQLEGIMLEEKPYKNHSLKLNDIAKKLDITAHHFSQLLNDNLEKNFAVFINEYRVEEAKKLLFNNDKFTLEAIGFDAGFSSKSTFYATFKKITGQTPAEFQKKNPPSL